MLRDVGSHDGFVIHTALLFIQYVLQRPADDDIVKSVQTLFWICVLHAALSLLNAIIFEQAKADTWRA